MTSLMQQSLQLHNNFFSIIKTITENSTALTKFAPYWSNRSATSVCPFSQAYVSAVSPVCVCACTSAPASSKYLPQTIVWLFLVCSFFSTYIITKEIYTHYLTSSKWPSCAASISGVDAPNSSSAPFFIRKSATSRKPPQHANVNAVSWVSSVWAFIFAPNRKYCHI